LIVLPEIENTCKTKFADKMMYVGRLGMAASVILALSLPVAAMVNSSANQLIIGMIFGFLVTPLFSWLVRWANNNASFLFVPLEDGLR